MFVVLSWSLKDVDRMAKNLSHLKSIFSAEVEQGDTLPTCFIPHAVNRYSFCGLFSCILQGLFLLVITYGLLFKMAPKRSA